MPDPGAVRAFGFQSILASAGFSPVFLLHLKLDFLNKPISGIIWSYSASADWQLIWHCALSPSGDMSRVTKTQIYLRTVLCNFLHFVFCVQCDRSTYSVHDYTAHQCGKLKK